MRKARVETVAAVDVGSNSLRMMIAEITSDGEIIPLEELLKSTNLGRDTFSYGRVQLETIHDTCDTLKGFAKVMQDYRIKNYRAVSTSGIREAENCEYVLEQIRLRTGLTVEVINNAQERFLMFKAIRNHLPKSMKIYHRGTLIVNIGSGGVEISVYSKGNLRFTEYIRVGSLRLREILADLERLTLDFPSIVEEFVESRIDFLQPRLEKLNIRSFIGLGGELRTITRLCTGNDNSKDEKFISKEALSSLYNRVHTMTTEQIIQDYGLDRSQAGVLLPSIIMFNRFLKMTGADGIYTPMVSLRHGMLADMADECFATPRKKEAIEDIISSVLHIGQKYNFDEKHCRYIEKLCLEIFEQTAKIHRMGDREKLYLQVAALLHDVGKHVNLNMHDMHSYNIIRYANIMGFSNRELDIVANVARYHSDDTPKLSHENYIILSVEDRITISKLAAILKIGESLDISHKRKIEKIETFISGRELIFKVQSTDDLLLEEWNFADTATFFEEVMGYKPVIKRRR